MTIDSTTGPAGRGASPREVVGALSMLALVCFLALLGAGRSDGAGGTDPRIAAAGGSRPLVIEAPIEGAIDPVTKDFVESVLERARHDDADAVVFTMDTPGGLSTSMDDIAAAIMNDDDLPVIVFVAPRGARAASAGAFITMASDVAAMAPNTNIGSATPIQGNGQDVGKDLRRKVINDAVARMRSMAKEHGRDVEFAEEAIRTAENIDAREALERGVIEFVATDLDTLLEDVDGYETKPKGITLDTADARVVHVEVPAHLRLLKIFIDPNILFLLFSAGVLGIAFEITHPGTVLPGVVGAIALIIALFGFQVLPTNVAGVALLLLALVLFVAEAVVVSHGVLGVGGAVSLVVGGLLLFDRDSGVSISLPLLVGVALAFLGFFGVIVRKAMAARRSPVTTGSEMLIGEIATVRSDLSPIGKVWVAGELWTAEATDQAVVPAGTEVVIEEVRGLRLVVAHRAGDHSPATDNTKGSD